MTTQRWTYRWSGGKLERSGAVSSAYLHAWEYEPASEGAWTFSEAEVDQVRRWRTRRPDLAPAEILVGDRTFDVPAAPHAVPPLPARRVPHR